MQTLETGDLIERTFASEIRTHLNCYERFWGNFIGNNGNNQMIDITGESPKQHDVRLQISQLSYSLMHNALALLRIANRIRSAEYTLNQDTSAQAYFERRDIFNSITVECGKVRDHLESIYNSLKEANKSNSIDKIYKDLQELHSIRHIGIHGKELPYFIENEQVYLPFFNRESGWNNEKKWDEAIIGEPFALWANQTIYLVVAKINEVFCKLIEVFEDLYQSKTISVVSNNDVHNSVASGTIHSLGISGTSNPSGTSGSSGFGGVSGFSKP